MNNTEKTTHLTERPPKRKANRTWERVGWKHEDQSWTRYTIFDSTTGATAYNRAIFALEFPRRYIAMELRRMRGQLRQVVREGPKP